jgi:hypothetical protein
MFKFISIFFIFYLQVFAFTVKISANVGEDTITSRDVEIRAMLIKALNPNIPNNSIEETALEGLIQEKLIFQMAEKNEFEIPESEIENEINQILNKNPTIKKAITSKEIRSSFKNQIKGEIIFSSILQSQLKGKLDFSNDEVNRFRASYNEQTDNKINNAEARQMLTSMKINETQTALLKTLKESTLIEKK